MTDEPRPRSGRRGSEPLQDSSLGAYVRSLRLSRGLTTRQLAEESGISQGYLSKVERGTVRRPAESVIEGLANALAISRDELESHVDVPSAGIDEDQHREGSHSRVIPLLAEKYGYDEWPARHRFVPAPSTDPLSLALVGRYLEQGKQAHFNGDVPLAIEQLRMGLLTLEHLSLPADDLGVRELYIELLYRLAEFELDIRHSKAALQHIERAITLRLVSGSAGTEQETGFPVPTAHLYRSRAAIKVALGHWNGAETDFEHSRTMIVSDKLLKIEAARLTTLAWFRHRQGKYDDAHRLLHDGLHLQERIGTKPRSRAYPLAMSNVDPWEVRNDIQMLARARLNEKLLIVNPKDVKRLKAALKGQQEALRAFEESLDDRNAADVQVRLADIHTRLGGILSRKHEANEHFDVAEWLARKALVYGERFGMVYPQIDARRQLGHTLETRGRLDEANEQMQLALQLTSQIEDPYTVACVQKAAGSVLLHMAEMGGAEQPMAIRRAEVLLESAEEIFRQLGAKEQLNRAWVRLHHLAELTETSKVAEPASFDRHELTREAG